MTLQVKREYEIWSVGYVDGVEEMNLVWETWQGWDASQMDQAEWIWQEFGDLIKSIFS